MALLAVCAEEGLLVHSGSHRTQTLAPSCAGASAPVKTSSSQELPPLFAAGMPVVIIDGIWSGSTWTLVLWRWQCTVSSGHFGTKPIALSHKIQHRVSRYVIGVLWEYLAVPKHARAIFL